MIILINKVHKRSTIFDLFNIGIPHIHLSQFSISSLSHSPSNSSNSSSKFSSLLINSTKLDASLQPTLGLFSQFLLTKISFSKFSGCKQRFPKFVKMTASEKIYALSLFENLQCQIFALLKAFQFETSNDVFPTITKGS